MKEVQRAFALAKTTGDFGEVMEIVVTKTGNYNAVMELLEEAVDIAPDNHSALYALSLAYSRQGNATLAISTLYRAIGIKPDDLYRQVLVSLLDCAGRYDEAINVLKVLEAQKSKSVDIKVKIAELEAKKVKAASVVKGGAGRSQVRRLI